MYKKITIWIIFLIIWIFIFFYFSIFWSIFKDIPIDTVNVNELNMHNWSLITNLLNEDNYKKVWINPNNYENFERFLTDFQSFTWVKIDPINENFTIWIDKWNWNILFVPFRFIKNKELFDKYENKSLAILDIYWAYKNWLIYWWINSSYWNKILFEDDFQYPQTSELNKIFNVNLSDESSNIFNKIKSLTSSEEIWLDNTKLLAYLYDLSWNYNEAKNTREEICTKYISSCDINLNLNIYWKTVDSNWNQLSWVKIELLNDKSINTESDTNWNFILNFKFSSFSHIRIKSSIAGYSDWYSTISINDYSSEDKNKKYNVNFTLNKAHNTTFINNDNKNNFKKWKYYVIEVPYSKYFIPIDWLYFIDWTKYINNNLIIYTYQFNKDSNMDNLLENDTFEPVHWYVWNIMKTFWMPYIQFIDKDSWKELFIKSSNPMILQNQIYHMKELYENHDKIYDKLTNEDMKFLVKKSEELGWYPIDFNFLTTNNFLRWPARWSLDRVTWIWSNVWSRVLNTDWLIELPFYHIKDN